jgi:phytoene dehydrogenase-like protein
MIKKCDDIVVGSGISGMTMALILGMNGRKVLLIEKNPFTGGSISRFYRKGVPFDTGFHFTGGLHKGGILYDILSVLEIRDLIQPIFLSSEHANCFFFESENRIYEIPYGIDNIKEKFKDYFPTEASAIDTYFDKVQYICNETPSMNLRTFFSQQNFLDEDYISLEEVLNNLTKNNVLKALLSGFAMCHGVKPGEISFANHVRVCQGLYQSVARIKNGGSAFINAFETKFKEYDIEICKNTYIVSLADINNRRVGRFILNTGEEVASDNCIFTIHPKEILKILPEEYLTRAFIDRISSFESSAGFFSVFAVLDPGYEEPDFGSSIFSIFPHCDINRLLDPTNKDESALVIIRSVEESGGKTYRTVNTFEPSFIEHVEKWKNSRTGSRPQAYQEYKKSKVESIISRILKVFPGYKDRLKVVDSASVLTFRDYLNNYDGSAYGIKQKVRQINLMGKLPLKNLYAAGQSSLLPGIIGAMMSSFIVARSILDEERYSKFLLRNLGQ